jgi:hypothetical protein
VCLRERDGLDVLRARSLTGRGVALALLMVLAAGCASLPTAGAAPIADVGTLVGRWAGTTSPSDQPFALTINPGGTLVAAWGGQTRWGTVTVQGGEATYEMQPGGYEGRIRLFDEGGARRLVLSDARATLRAQAVPVRVAGR